MGYLIQTQQQTVQILGESSVRNVIEVGFTTEPSNVYCVLVFGTKSFPGVPLSSLIGAKVGEVADVIEAEMARDEVIGAAWGQDIDASGLLTAHIDFVVEYVSANPAVFGPQTGIARVPMTDFDFLGPLSQVAGRIDEAIANLQAIANI